MKKRNIPGSPVKKDRIPGSPMKKAIKWEEARYFRTWP
jgi:hypothetical protein